MVSILLQDEHTGERRPAHRVAADWIFANNNASHDDRRLTRLAAELVDGKSYDDQLHSINMRRRQMRENRRENYASENALLNDLEAYVELTHRIRNAGNATSIEVSGLPGLVIAADRSIERVMRERRVSTEVQRRQERSPEQTAMEEIVSASYRPRVQAVLDQFDGQNLTNAAIESRLVNMQSGRGWFGESWDKAQALAVFRRQMQIEAGAQPERPRGGIIIPEAQAAPAGGDNRAVNDSINEILGTAGAGLMNPSRTDHNEVRRQAIAIVRRHQALVTMEGPEGQAQRDRVYGQLVRAYDNGNGSTTAMANGYALDVLLRAVERQENPSLERFTRETFAARTQRYIEYARDPAAWRAAHERDEPAAGADAAAAGGDAPAGGRGGALRLYRNGNRAAPPSSEIPKLDTNQVQDLQRMLESAGFSVGPRGADGKYGPDTHDAFKRFAQANGINLTEVDFTQQNEQGVATQPLALRFMQLLEAAITARGGQAAAGGAEPAAGAEQPAAGGQTLTAAGQRLLAAVAQHASVSDAVMNLRTVEAAENAPEADRTAAEQLRTTASMPNDALGARNALLRTGITGRYQLNESQSGSLNFVENGQSLEVHSDFIRSVETLLNSLSSTDRDMVVDGKWDARLGAILGQEGMVQIVQAGLSDPASIGSPAATPGQTGGQGNGR